MPPFFNFGNVVRKSIFTSNEIESLNFAPRKAKRACGQFPNDVVTFKRLY